MDKHDTLLIACGSQEDRGILRENLGERFHLLVASSRSQAMLLMQQNIDCIAAVLLNLSGTEMPDGDLMLWQEAMEPYGKLPFIVIGRQCGPELLNAAFSYGVADVIPLDYEPYAMLHRIENIVELSIHQMHLQAMVEEQANILRHTNESLVDALSAIIEYRSVESGQHILRIRQFTRILLEEVRRSCPEYQLTERAVAVISSAAALHDIGKIAIPDAILMKPGKLTREEYETMKTHSLMGCRILDELGDMGDAEYMRYAHNICHYHHERWDGGGYPEGLAGDDIPLCAQVVGIADVYDALTSKRVYKDAVSFSKAVNMILNGECGQFSPKLLECFKHVTREYEDLARAYADGMSPKSEVFDTTLPPPAKSRDKDTIDRVYAKYLALVHYINGFLMEADLDQGLFHLVYNPYPDLAPFHKADTLEDVIRMTLEQVVIPEERERMEHFFREEVVDFVEEDLRRMTTKFRLRSPKRPEGEEYEITLLRIRPQDSGRRTLAVLARKLQQTLPLSGPEAEMPLWEEESYCCRNDEGWTLVRLGGWKIAGYTEEELRERFGGKLTALIHPEDRDMVRRECGQQLRQGTQLHLEYRICNRDGSTGWVMHKSRVFLGENGQERMYTVLSDMSRTRAAYDEMHRRLESYEIILAQTENVLFEWDAERDSVAYSETWDTIFGYSPMTEHFLRDMKEHSHIHPDDGILLEGCVSNLKNGSNYEMVEIRIATDKGRYLWCRMRASAIRDGQGKLRKVAGIVINIDAEKKAEHQLRDSAQRDSLTKLLNKDTARRRAEEYLNRRADGVTCAMLIIDLDNFKQVNDQYGHLFGDAVLTQVAREIEKMFRNQDIVARIGGDEFLVLMRNVSDRTLVENRCRRLLRILRNIFRNQNHDLPLSCSIGVAMVPEHGSTYYDLFNRADQALYRAKAGGKDDVVFYDPAREQFPSLQGRPTAVSNRIDSDQEPGLADDNIVRHVFQRLYAAKDVESSVNEILAMIGKMMNVSRVYIFENTEDNRFCSNTFEWCNEGIQPEIGYLQNISYETDIPGYEDNFNEQGIFYCPDISVLPKNAYDILEPQGIKSMLQCAIRERGQFRGYVGFDECVNQRFWTQEQIQALTYFAEMLSVFLLKHRRQEQALARAEDLSSILDNQNAWIYIIDPETCQLKYLNAKTKLLAPEVKPGMRCYEALMGKPERCAGCPALKIQETVNNSAVMRNDQFQMEVLAEATRIRWQGEDSCLLTCRLIPGKQP